MTDGIIDLFFKRTNLLAKFLTQAAQKIAIQCHSIDFHLHQYREEWQLDIVVQVQQAMAAQVFHNWLSQAQRHIGICSSIICGQAYGYLCHADHLATCTYQLSDGRHYMAQALEYQVFQAKPTPARVR